MCRVVGNEAENTKSKNQDYLGFQKLGSFLQKCFYAKMSLFRSYLISVYLNLYKNIKLSQYTYIFN